VEVLCLEAALDVVDVVAVRREIVQKRFGNDEFGVRSRPDDRIADVGRHGRDRREKALEALQVLASQFPKKSPAGGGGVGRIDVVCQANL
jgi:hypothetical protein